jgi:serine/threonine-protein kinase RsbW
MQIRLILEEALTNAAKHGNRFDLGLDVVIDVEYENGTLVFTVTDQGRGFKPETVPDPLVQTELKSSGRGIYLIRQLADDVRFNDKGNVITITKKIAKSA